MNNAYSRFYVYISPDCGKNVNKARREFDAKFTPILMNEIIPYIDRHFRVLTNRDHRALAGLSWGGYQTFQIGLNNLDRLAPLLFKN